MMADLGSKRAQGLLEELKTIIDEQEVIISQKNVQIRNLQLEVQNLIKTRDSLTEKVQQSEAHSSPHKKHHRRKSSGSRSKSSSNCVTNGQTDDRPADDMVSTKKVSVDRSGSFQRKHLEEQDAKPSSDSYQLSSDLKDKQVEVLRNRYGGGAKSDHAARVIQEAYRNHRMKVNFRKIRTSKIRRITVDSSSRSLHHVVQTDSVSTTSLPCISPDIKESGNDVEVVELVLEHSFVDSGQKTGNDVNQQISAEINLTNIYGEAPADSSQNNIISKNACDSDQANNQSTVAPKDKGQPKSPRISSPPTQDELVARILADAPAATLQYVSTRRKKHAYDTVVLKNKPALPATPEDPAHAVLESVPMRRQASTKTIVLRSSDGETGNHRLSPWRGAGSEHSLTSENDADLESTRSSDTASIASDISVAPGDVMRSGYQRKSTLSIRESWQSDVTNDVMRKRLYRIGLNLFNMKPGKGLTFLMEHNFVARSPPTVASFLLNRKGLSRQMVGEYLGNTQKAFNQEVLDSACELMDFSGQELDEALREFQAQVKVQGEAQKVERLVEAFSQRYCTCNPKLIDGLQNPDSIFVLAFAIIMLNTDLHSPNMKYEKRMTEEEFIRNLRGVDNGDDLSEILLKNIYNRIRSQELITLDDHVTQVVQVENSIVGKKPVVAVPHRRLVCYCRLYQVNDPTKSQKLGLHQREVFLFNDMILITKILHRKKAGTTYSFKLSFSLYGMSYLIFDATHYPYGIRLINSMDNKVLVTFNAPNEQDRTRFVNDIRECIAEVQQMESLRIEAELERAQTNPTTDVRTNNSNLIETKKISASMQNLNSPPQMTSPLISDSRPTSYFGLTPVNENGNNNNNNNNVISMGRGRNDKELPPSRHFPSLSTFFGYSGKKSGVKRESRILKTPLGSPTKNSNSPTITLTLHEV